MKRLLSSIKHTPMLLALLFIALFFFPAAIVAPPESVSNSIVTAVGIDKRDEEFAVSMLTYLSYPNQTYTDNYEVFTATGKTLGEALTKAGLQVGKNISLFHTHAAIISGKMLEEDIAPSLDYLVRVASLPQSCVLIGTNVSSKEFLEFIQKLDKQLDITLEELTFYNSNYVFWNDTTIDAFLTDYHSPTRSSLMSYLPLVDGDINGIPIEGGSDQASGGGTGGSGGGGNSSDSTSPSPAQTKSAKQLVNDGSMLIIKDGKKTRIIPREILRGINWFNTNTTGAVLMLDDVSDEKFDSAQLVYRVNKKQIRKLLEFENGHPVLTMNVRAFVNLTEVNGEKEDLTKVREASYVSDVVRQKIEELIKKQIYSALQILIEDNADILDLYNEFYRAHRGETRKFTNEMEDKNDFLKEIIMKVVVTVLPN